MRELMDRESFAAVVAENARRRELPHPEWITDAEWRVKPYESWWADVRRGKEYIEQSRKRPFTHAEVVAQQRRLDAQCGIRNDFLEV
jgi:hypothetical protein